MTHAGLFSGIGGFSLAANLAGWENIFDVELDSWCRKVLHKNFPTTQLYDDVCTFDGRPFRGAIDVLSGGFPCQPWSIAGKGLGTADPRHLWPQYLRIIREIQPGFVVGENVRGLLSWGGGIQFEAVCADLEAAGYQVQPFLLPAVSVGAPHKRDRFWFVAHATSQRCEELQAIQGRPAKQPQCGHVRSASTDPAGFGWETGQIRALYQRQGEAAAQVSHEKWPSLFTATNGCFGPLTEPPLCAANDGVPSRLVRPDRSRILKAAGNAIVPQVALQIFKAIQATTQ